MQSLHIEGPVSLAEIRIDRLSKIIYVFGDEHIRAMRCPDPNAITIRIDEFLDEIVKTTPKTIDLFLELDFPAMANLNMRNVTYAIKKDTSNITPQPSPDYITDIFHQFFDCFQLDKRNCQYENLRAHYTDIRYVGSTSYIMVYHDNLDEVYRQVQIQRMRRPLFSNLPQQDLRPIVKLIIDDGLRILEHLPLQKEDIYFIAKIDKQLRQIRDPEVLRAIHEYYDDKIWTALLNAEDQYRSYDENTDIQAIKIGFTHLFEYASMLFEVYVVGRMFRDFDGQSPDNVILYLGDVHSQRIVDFLRTIPGARIVHQQSSDTNDVDKQCLDMSGFKLPFFHYF